jgi:hypothetical protein
MNKSFILLLCLLVFPSVNAAHYYNPDDNKVLYVQMEHFELRKVKADRAMDDGFWDSDDEDHWKFWYRFTVNVQNVVIRAEAIDGENDHDTRIETWKIGDRSANSIYTKTGGDFPTYVDNMYVKVSYEYLGTPYEIYFVVYTDGDPNVGSGVLGVNYAPGVTTANELIPENFQVTDSQGLYNKGDPKNPIDVIQPPKFPSFDFLNPTDILEIFINQLLGFVLLYLGITLIGQGQGSMVFAGIILIIVGGIFVVSSYLIVFNIINSLYGAIKEITGFFS